MSHLLLSGYRGAQSKAIQNLEQVHASYKICIYDEIYNATQICDTIWMIGHYFNRVRPSAEQELASGRLCFRIGWI